jgi:SUKH-4 immunity protein of toxin-antitoxin system
VNSDPDLPVVPGVFEPTGATPVIGRVGDEGVYRLNDVDGPVTYVANYDSSVSYVNATVSAFAATLRLFREVTDRLPAGSDSSVFVAAAASLEAAFTAIDPTATRDPDHFWPSLLADVADGDYTDEEVFSAPSSGTGES